VYTYHPDSVVSREWPPPIDEAAKKLKDEEDWKPELA
jgi:hypothetical protein